LAPEVLSASSWTDLPHLEKIDVYAFGVLTQLVTAQASPNEDYSRENDEDQGLIRDDQPGIYIAERWSRVIEMCFAVEPNNRPSMVELFDLLNRDH
jgi:hypothetical protein